ncbi:hypothetical protein D910_08229 [Dendroctonus ponderosae]|uniref:Protein KRI1 homolog n=2 Tax=Dendroctonus ponderosae TaxID=77166 RepID=U4UAG0_DENPD|nr:hypothetical protein D910_08229 [Dendroctonus ponderosae]
MGKIELFQEESDSEYELNVNNAYAKNYDVWRKKEELHKLQARYGEGVLDDSDSSSSSEDEEVTFNEEDDKAFFKTLACLRSNDPRIYDKNYHFFKDRQADAAKGKAVKEKPLYPKDYQRKMLLEHGPNLSDEEIEPEAGPSYVEEQEQLKKKIIEVAKLDDDEEDEAGLGGLLQIRRKTKQEQKETEEEYRQWLKGQTEDIQDEETKAELKPLRDFWNHPELDEDEKYLRDYFLNKRYLEEDRGDHIPTYEEIVNPIDETELEKQEEFEHKFNFRFEEPDQDFIKRYPRTIENSIRRTDDKRKAKRAETKERKKREKEEKMAEIKKMQELKRKEIEEKLQKLKEVTGATDLAFGDEDVDGEFDPEAHDKRMQSLFNDEFYQGQETDEKPEFPDIDKELEIENWSRWQNEEKSEVSPHCEDDNFNMDADYDPATVSKQEAADGSKGKRKRKKKSKVAEALSRPKPKFDPNEKEYEKYFDEYYKLDCEDIIGDLPCRFKYREVIPNDFGLTVEEILLANDKELNKWCSIKKTVQRRPDSIEKYEQMAYSNKGKNIELKKRILPSLFVEEPTEENNCKEAVEKEATNSNNNAPNGKKPDTMEPNAWQSSNGTTDPPVKGRKKKLQKSESENPTKDETEAVQSNKRKKKKNSGPLPSLVADELTEENEMGIKKNKSGGTMQLNALQSSNGTPDRPVKGRKRKLQKSEVEAVSKSSLKAENPTNDETEATQSKKRKKKDNAGKRSLVAASIKLTEETETEIRKKDASNKKNESSETNGGTVELNALQSSNGTTDPPVKGRKKKLQKSESTTAEEMVKSEPEGPGKKRKKKNKAKKSAGKDESIISSKKNRKRSLNDSEARQGGKRSKGNKPSSLESSISDARLAAFGINAKKYRNKLKYGKNPSS